jgi:hypothetical protein
MTGTYYTDITHYLDMDGNIVSEMPGPAKKLASFLALIIDATSALDDENFHDIGIRCRKRKCEGTILSRKDIETECLIWHCHLCGHNGVISNWQGTRWNKGKKDENHM